MTNGVFISLEGTEGCGKSTQMQLLVDRLCAEGHKLVQNQEPGATAIGKEIRRLLLDPAHSEMTSMTELLLMFASRAQAAAEIVRPALQSGAIVVSDRYTDSTLAYQGAARGMGFDLVRRAHQLALGDLLPNLTLCIAVDVAEGLERAHRRNQKSTGPVESRIDEQSLAFHESVMKGYRQIAFEEPVRFKIVDGNGSLHTVAERIWAQVSPLMKDRD